MNFDVSKEQNQLYKWKSRKTLFTVLIAIFVLFTVAGVNSTFNNPGITDTDRIENAVFGIVSLLLLGASIFGRIYASKSIASAVEAIGQKENELVQAFSHAHLSDLSTYNFPDDVIPEKGEVCYWAAPATFVEEKTITTGYKTQSSGLSVGLAPGIRLHSGTSVSTPIKKTVTTSYFGRILITNMRLLYLAPKGGFDKSLKSISSISNDPYAIQLQIGDKVQRINTQKSIMACQIIRLAVKEAKQN